MNRKIENKIMHKILGKRSMGKLKKDLEKRKQRKGK